MDKIGPAHLPALAHARLFAIMMVIAITAGALLRMALLVSYPHPQAGWTDMSAALLSGLGLDAAVTWLLLLPLAVILTAAQRPWARSQWTARIVLALAVFAAGFGCAIEWFFFQEFTARLNHIAVDYVLYPHEVLVNIWQGYPVTLVLVALAALATAGGWWLARWCTTTASAIDGSRLMSRMNRWQRLSMMVGATLIALVALKLVPERVSPDRIVAGVGQHGLVQLARAFTTAHLDYPDFYSTIPSAEANRRAARMLGFAQPFSATAAPSKRIIAATSATRAYDMLVILEESLGSEFCGSVGGVTPVTPQLDRWAKEGWLLSDLVPTGNRTVRGIEGVLGSFLPVPPDSVVKRDRSIGFATVASSASAAGYTTEWFYGGFGAFDNMEPFASQAGFQAFRDDGLLGHGSEFPTDAFRTAWGVADEHLFTAILERQRAAQLSGEPLFITGLTVSNHSPFLVPGGRHSTTSTKRLVWFTVIAGLLVIATIGLWLLRRRIGWGLVVTPLLIGWIAWGIYGNAKIGASGTRTDAVAYADGCIGRYLDQAKAAGILDHTVVLIVGDHGARVYGSAQFPMESYRIPGLFLTPDSRWRGQRHTALCSQIDLAPTLLALAGVNADVPFLGHDLTRADAPARAFMQHNRDVALLLPDVMVMLGLQKKTDIYRRQGRDGLAPQPLTATEIAAQPRWGELIRDTQACYQVADELYQHGIYRLP